MQITVFGLCSQNCRNVYLSGLLSNYYQSLLVKVMSLSTRSVQTLGFVPDRRAIKTSGEAEPTDLSDANIRTVPSREMYPDHTVLRAIRG